MSFVISAWKTTFTELAKPKKLSEQQHGVVEADEGLEEREAQEGQEELEEEVGVVEGLLPEVAEMMTMTTVTMMMTKVRREVVQEEEREVRRP